MRDRIEELARDYGLWPEIVPHDVSEKGIATIAESVIQCQIVRFAQAIRNEALESAAMECEKRGKRIGDNDDHWGPEYASRIRKLKCS